MSGQGTHRLRNMAFLLEVHMEEGEGEEEEEEEEEVAVLDAFKYMQVVCSGKI